MAESTNTYQRLANAILTAMDKREKSFVNGGYMLSIREALVQSTAVPQLVDIGTIMMLGNLGATETWARENTTKKPMQAVKVRRINYHGVV